MERRFPNRHNPAFALFFNGDLEIAVPFLQLDSVKKMYTGI
jgi:hypothetical protein